MHLAGVYPLKINNIYRYEYLIYIYILCLLYFASGCHLYEGTTCGVVQSFALEEANYIKLNLFNCEDFQRF